MKHKQNIHWSRLLRRALALFLATLAAWLLLVCAGAGAAGSAVRGVMFRAESPVPDRARVVSWAVSEVFAAVSVDG